MDMRLNRQLQECGFTIFDYKRENGFVVFEDYWTGDTIAVCNDTQADFEATLRPDWFHVSGLTNE